MGYASRSLLRPPCSPVSATIRPQEGRTVVKPTVALVLSVGIAIGCGGRSDSPTPASGPAPDQPSLPATRAVPLDGGASANPAAAELAAVEKVYATCQTYRDTATVTVEYYGPSRARAEYDRKPRQVKTAFERGGAIRFEYRQPILDRGPHPRKEWVCVVWAKGEEVREWPEDRNPIIKQFGKDPQRVLAVLTGVTQGTSTKIPAMLLPRVARELKPEVGFTPGRGAKQPAPPGFAAVYRDAVRLADDEIGGTKCYVLRHAMEALNFDDLSKFQVTTTFWIDANAHLIRRAETEMAMKDGMRSVTRIDYAPAIDVGLDPKELEFNPPK